MKHPRLLALVALGTLAACGGHDAPDKASDSLIAAVTAPGPVAKNPHVRATDIGHAVDSTNRIMGGVSSTFHQADTIFVSLRTEYVAEGAKLAVRVLAAKSTVDSAAVNSPAPNPEGQATMSVRLAAPAKGWPLGNHQIEVLLDGVSQGLSDITIVK